MSAAINISNGVAFLAIAGIMLSGLVFLIYGLLSRDKLTVNNFLISNRSLSGKAYANTYYATNVSLSGNIIFFLAAHQLYGWMMGLAVVVYTIVQLYILHSVKKLQINFDEISTVSDLWYSVFPSSKVAKAMSYCIVIGCLLGVFLELYVGSAILSVLLPDTAAYKAGSFFVLGLLVISYVYFGGYKAIIKTDKWQVYLLLMSVVTLILFVATAPSIGEAVNTSFVSKVLGHQETGSSFYIFLFWVCTLNVLLCIIDISTWQRINAVVSISEARKELIKGLWKFALIFGGPMICIVVLGAKGYSFSDMPAFLNIIYSESGQFSYIVFPLVVVGFSAALFSTADTVLISAAYGLCDKNTFLPAIQKIPEDERPLVLRKYLSKSTFGLIVVLSIFYYIQGQGIADYIMPIIYAVWGLLIGIAVLPMYALRRMHKKLPKLKASKRSERILLSTFVICGIISIIASFIEIKTDNMLYSQLGNLASVLTVIIGLSITVITDKKASKSSPQLKKLHENFA